MKRVVAIIIVLAAGTAVAAQNPGDAQALFSQLKVAVQREDRAAVAALMDFPITVQMIGVRIPIATQQAFFERYNDIFTQKMREAVDRADPNSVATKAVGGRFAVTMLIVPEEDGPGASSPSVGAAPASGPRRISVRAGPHPTQLSGALATGRADAYVVFVPKGVLLDVRLERVGRRAFVRVTDEKTGAPLNPRFADGGLVVSGRPAADGNYRIAVQRTADAPEEHLPYVLSVRMR